MTYSALEIARKLIIRASDDEANGGELMTNLKLQKMLYYENGYHLAVFDEPLIDEPIEAWMYGPVVSKVYDLYSKSGSDGLDKEPGEKEVALTDEEEELFSEVFDAYKPFSAIGLMQKTHSEDPWQNALPHDRGTVISNKAMTDFFKKKLA